MRQLSYRSPSGEFTATPSLTYPYTASFPQITALWWQHHWNISARSTFIALRLYCLLNQWFLNALMHSSTREMTGYWRSSLLTWARDFHNGLTGRNSLEVKKTLFNSKREKLDKKIMIKIIDKNDMYFFKKPSVCKVCSLQLHGLPFDMTEFRSSPDPWPFSSEEPGWNFPYEPKAKLVPVIGPPGCTASYGTSCVKTQLGPLWFRESQIRLVKSVDRVAERLADGKVSISITRPAWGSLSSIIFVVTVFLYNS